MSDEPVVVAEASSEMDAAIWVDALRGEGIEATTYQRGEGAALGGTISPGFSAFPILVRRSDVAAARSVIAELAGGDVLSAVRTREETDARRNRAMRIVVGLVVVVVLAGVLGRLVALAL